VGRHRTGRRIAVGIVSAAVLAGCAFDRPLPTHDGTLDSGAGFEGILRLDGECVWVDSIDFDRMALNVVWPAGYHWRGPPLEVIDRTGVVIAREGDLVSFGIVEHKRGIVGACPLGDTALATEIVSVNGEDRFRAPTRTYRPVIR
jgi:hypothetical protein